jgi:hypothetical protein
LQQRIDHLGNIQPFGQKTDAPVDLAQAFLAVQIVAVFRAVAVRCRPGNHLDHFRPFDPQQELAFGSQPGMADRGDVILGANRQRRGHQPLFLVGVVVFLGEGFIHFVILTK